MPSLQEKRDLIHLAMVSSFMGENLAKLSKDDWATLYFSWNQVQNFQLTLSKDQLSSCENLAYLIKVRRFATQLGHLFECACKKASSLPNIVAKKLLEQFRLQEKIPSQGWSYSDSSSILKNGSWEINLRTGRSKNAQGEISTGVIEIKSDFSRVFGDKKRFVCTLCGNERRFFSPFLGELKIICEKLDQLFRQVDGVWQIYVPYSHLQTKLPNIFISDYTCWLSDDDKRYYFVNRKSGKTVYYMAQGKIFSHVSKQQVHCFLPPQKITVGEKWIESWHYILHLHPSQKERWQIYPRYLGPDGKTLTLKEQGAGWFVEIFSQKFYLKTQVEERLVPQMLVFSLPGENRQMALLPFSATFYKKEGLGHPVFFNPPHLESTDLQEGTLRYLFIPFNGESFDCQTSEEKAFIAYLFLVRGRNGDYKKALDYLCQISESTQPSDGLWKTLFAMLTSSKACKDASPGASSVGLYAYYLIYQIWPPSKGLINKWDKGQIDGLGGILSDRCQQGARLARRSCSFALSNTIEKEIHEQTKDCRDKKVLDTSGYIFIDQYPDWDQKSKFPVGHQFKLKKNSGSSFVTKLNEAKKVSLIPSLHVGSYPIKRFRKDWSLACNNEYWAERMAFYLSRLKPRKNQTILLPFFSLYKAWKEKGEIENYRNMNRELLVSIHKNVKTETFSFSKLYTREVVSTLSLYLWKRETSPSFALVTKENPEQFICKIQGCVDSTKASPVKKKSPFPIPSKEREQISKKRKQYKRAILNTLNSYEKEWEKGGIRMGDIQRYVPINIKNVKQEVEKGIKSLKGQLKERASELKGTVFSGKFPALMAREYIDGVATRDVGKIIEAFYRWGEQGLLKFNPTLGKKSCEKIRPLMERYLHAKVELSYLEQILGKVKECESDEKDLVKRKELYDLIFLKRPEKRENQFELLVFEWIMGFCLRENQVNIIEDFKKKKLDSIIQAAMGSGKSSVIFPRIAYFISMHTDKVPLYLCHESQWLTARKVVTRSQKRNFSDVIILDYSSKQLHEAAILKRCLAKCRRAKTHKMCLMMQNDMLALLELELLFANGQLQQSKEAPLIERIKLLREILLFFRNEAIAISDEVDLSMNVFTGVNITQGGEVAIPHAQVHLIFQIFEFLRTDPALEKIVGLMKNNQSKVKFYVYAQQLLPLLIKKTATVSTLLLKKEHHASFERYVLNSIDPKLEEEVLKEEIGKDVKDPDVSFLYYFHHELAKSSRNQRKMAADLIALARKFLSTFLPPILERSFAQDYGKRKNSFGRKIGKSIAPYLAGREANTSIWLIYEYLSYLFSSYYIDGPSVDDIREFALKMKELSKLFATRVDHCPLMKTAEARLFKRLTGFDFNTIFLSGNFEKARKKISSNPKFKADFAFDKALHEATYFPCFIGANPHSIVDQLHRLFGGSGTLTNRTSYHPRLQKNVSLDEGSEGSVLQLWHQMSQKKDLPMTSLKEIDVKVIIEIVKKDATIRSLIDAGGILRKIKREDLLKELLSIFRFQAVLHAYFDKDNREQFVLTCLSDGKLTHQPLAGTTRQDIKRSGVPLDKIFIIYDEPRTTGCHIDQRPDTRAILTVNRCKTTLRQAAQGAMRMRNAYFGQRFHVLVEVETESKRIDYKTLVADLLVNQAIEVSRQESRGALMTISSIVRNFAIKRQLNLCEDPEKNREQIAKYALQFVSKWEIHPYRDFGRLDRQLPILDLLNQHAKSELKKYEMETDQDAIKGVKEFLTRVKNLLDLKKDSFMPNYEYGQKGNLQLGTRVNVQTVQQVSQQTQLQSNDRLRNQLLSEIKGHEFKGEDFVCGEDKWFCGEYENFTELFNRKRRRFLSIHDYISRYERDKATHVADCFKPYRNCRLLATDNFLGVLANTQTSILDSQLRKPAHHFLIYRKKDQLYVILLSLQDVVAFKKIPHWLKDDAGLFNNRGICICGKKEWGNNFKEVMSFVNFYEGNIDQLLREYSNEIELFILEGAQEEKRKFLAYRAVNNGQWELYCSSKFLISRNHQKLLESHGFICCSERIKQDRSTAQKVRGYERNQVAKITPRLVPFLRGEQVQWLIKKSQFAFIPKRLAQFVPEHGVNHLSEDMAPLLLQKQVIHLNNKFIIRHLPDGKIKFLQKKGLLALDKTLFKHVPDEKLGLLESRIGEFLPGEIARIPTSLVNKLSEDQVPFLKRKEQLIMIPVKYRGKITEAQWKQLKQEKPNTIEKFVQEISANNLKPKILPIIFEYFSATQIIKLGSTYANCLSLNQWEAVAKATGGKAFIQGASVSAFSNKSKIVVKIFPSLSVQQVFVLDAKYANNITSDQWEILVNHSDRKSYIQKINDSELINKLDLSFAEDLIKKQVKELTSQSIIRGLSTDQIAWVSPQSINKLSFIQIAFVSRKDQVGKLIPENRVYLKEKGVQYLAIANVSVGQIPWIKDPDKLIHCPVENRCYLTPEQWETLKNKKGKKISKFIQDITINDLKKMKDLPFEYLSPTQIIGLGSTYADSLTEKQWKTIAKATGIGTYIAKINNQNVIEKIDPGFVPHLVSTQIKWLKTSAQWQAVVKRQIPHVLPKYVNNLTSDQLKHVSREDQVKALTDKIRYKYLGEEGVQHLAITEITKDQLPWIEDSNKLINCPVGDRVHLSTKQWEQLKKEKPNAIKKFVQETSVNNLKPNVLPLIFEYLSLTQIIKLGPTYAGSLSLNQWEGVAKATGGKAFIQSASVSAFSKEIVVKIFPSLSVQQVLKFPASYADKITSAQWNDLLQNKNSAITYIQGIKNQSVIANIDHGFVSHLTSNQLAWLTTSDQWKAVAFKQVPHVLPAHVNNLTSDQLKHVSREDQVKALTDKIRYKYLGEEGVQHLAITEITKDQLPWIKDSNKLINCPVENRCYLNLAQWKTLKNKKGKKISKFIQDITTSNLKEIKNLSIVFEYLSATQIIELGSTHAGDLSQQQWKKMSKAPDVQTYIAGITNPQHLSNILGEMRGHITIKQWGQLKKEFIRSTPIKAFSNEEKIIKVFPYLTAQQVLDLDVGYVAKITSAQWPEINSNYIEKIAVKDLFRVPAKFRYKLSLKQWKESENIDSLIPTSLQSFPTNVINYLFETSKNKQDVLSKIFAYNPTFLSEQNWKNILKNFLNQIDKIPVQFVEKIHPDLVPHFSKKQVQALTAFKHLEKVTFDQMSLLSEVQKQMIRGSFKSILNGNSSNHHLFYLATPKDVSGLVKTNQKKMAPPSAETRNIQEVIAGVVCLTVAALAAVWLSSRQSIRIGRVVCITTPVVYAGAVATIAYRFFSHFGRTKEFEFVRKIPKSVFSGKNSESRARAILKKGPLPCYVEQDRAVPFIDVLNTGELKAGKIKKEVSADGKMWSLSCTYTAPVYLCYGKSNFIYHAVETIRLSYDGKEVKGVSTRKIRKGKCDPTKNYPGLFL